MRVPFYFFFAEPRRNIGAEYDTEIHRSALKEGLLHEKEKPDPDSKGNCRLCKKGDESAAND